MDITKTISRNLAEWMATTPGMDTLKKVAARAGVGFGTVQRAKNGAGNTTVQNLDAIARAFRRSPTELVSYYAEETGRVETNGALQWRVEEPRKSYVTDPLLDELISVSGNMSERGKIELIGRAKELALQHPLVPLKQKPKTAA